VTRLSLTTALESWPLKKPFRISGNVFSESGNLLVTLDDGTQLGRGEAQGVYYHAETPESMAAQVESVRNAVEAGIDRAELQALLPAGGARNALDCALWELESRRTGKPVWMLAGLDMPRPLLSTWTIGGDAPDTMARDAVGYTAARSLKLKLIGDGADADRVRAVRAVRPDAWIGVDANQGLDRVRLEQLLPTLVEAGISLIEQPVPVGADATLEGLNSPIPLAADESAQTLADLAALRGRYDVINIKLDKCGGLTEGLAIARAARDYGLQVMVGNMVGTSLAMAPSFVVGQLCDIVDLDGPLLLARDRHRAVVYADGRIDCPPGVWGAALVEGVSA
jgi:L-alanine-DL-glutamate epimerase-like enolase superfamily enzyme